LLDLRNEHAFKQRGSIDLAILPAGVMPEMMDPNGIPQREQYSDFVYNGEGQNL